MTTPTPMGGGLDVDETAALLLERRQPEEPNEEIDEEVEEITETEEEVLTEESDELEQEAPEIEETEEQEEDAEPEEVAPSFESIQELAEALDMTPEEFLSKVKTRTKVDGVESEVTLAELQKGYQLEANYTRKNQAFIEEQKQFEQEREEARTKLNSDLEKAGQAFAMAQQQLTHEFNAIDWHKLQVEDPTQWAIKRQQFGERQAQINQSIEQATQTAQEAQKQQQAEEDGRNQKYLQQQNDLLLAAIPEWSEESTRVQGAAEVTDFLASQGFQPDEIANITDHRYILLARQAMSANKQASEIDIAKKKVKKVPKLIKPSAAQDKATAKARNVKALKQKLKGGNSRDLQAYLLAKRS